MPQFSTFGLCPVSQMPTLKPHPLSSTNEKWVEFTSPNVDVLLSIHHVNPSIHVFSLTAKNFPHRLSPIPSIPPSGAPIKLVRAAYFVLPDSYALSYISSPYLLVLSEVCFFFQFWVFFFPKEQLLVVWNFSVVFSYSVLFISSLIYGIAFL